MIDPIPAAGDYGGSCDTCERGQAKPGHQQCAACERLALEALNQLQQLVSDDDSALADLNAAILYARARGLAVASSVNKDDPTGEDGTTGAPVTVTYVAFPGAFTTDAECGQTSVTVKGRRF